MKKRKTYIWSKRVLALFLALSMIWLPLPNFAAFADDTLGGGTLGGDGVVTGGTLGGGTIGGDGVDSSGVIGGGTLGGGTSDTLGGGTIGGDGVIAGGTLGGGTTNEDAGDSGSDNTSANEGIVDNVADNTQDSSNANLDSSNNSDSSDNAGKVESAEGDSEDSEYSANLDGRINLNTICANPKDSNKGYGLYYLDSGSYYLSADLNLNNYSFNLAVLAGNTVSVDLNGYTLSAWSSAFSSCIRIYATDGNPGTLNLLDSSSAASGKIIGGKGSYTSYQATSINADSSDSTQASASTTKGASFLGGGVYVGDYAQFNLLGGNITGGSASYGAGIYAGTKSVVSLLGGSITGNTASNNGGGIYAIAATIKMWGGSTRSASSTLIDENSANNGGGVYLDYKSSMYICGGSISDNTASLDGGGIYCEGMLTTQSSSTSESACAMLSNKAGRKGGAICVYSCATNTRATIGAADIRYNSAGLQGGGIYSYSYKLKSSDNTLNTSESPLVIASAGSNMVYKNSQGLFTAQVCLYNNLATSAGDDLYADGANFSLKAVPTSSDTVWQLEKAYDKEQGNGALITGWFSDASGARWREGVSTLIEPADDLNAPIALKAAYASKEIAIKYHIDGSNQPLSENPALALSTLYGSVGETLDSAYLLSALPQSIQVNGSYYVIDTDKLKDAGVLVSEDERVNVVDVYYISAYAVTYVANGGSFPDGSIVQVVLVPKSSGAQATGPVSSPTRDGYALKNWNIQNSNGSYSPYAFNTQLSGNLELYAEWEEARTLTLVYDVLWQYIGIGTPNVSMQIPLGSTVDMSTLVIAGHENESAQKWLREAGNADTAVTDPFTMTDNLTLYAGEVISGSTSGDLGGTEDNQDTFYLSFNSNGGSYVRSVKMTGPTELDFDDEAYKPSRPGYSFVGWFSDYSYARKMSGKVTILGTTTVVACWEEGEESNDSVLGSSAGSNTSENENQNVNNVSGSDQSGSDGKTVQYYVQSNGTLLSGARVSSAKNSGASNALGASSSLTSERSGLQSQSATSTSGGAASFDSAVTQDSEASDSDALYESSYISASRSNGSSEESRDAGALDSFSPSAKSVILVVVLATVLFVLLVAASLSFAYIRSKKRH